MRAKSFCNVLVIAAVFSIGAMALTPDSALAKPRPYKATIEALAIGFPFGVFLEEGLGLSIEYEGAIDYKKAK